MYRRSAIFEMTDDDLATKPQNPCSHQDEHPTLHGQPASDLPPSFETLVKFLLMPPLGK